MPKIDVTALPFVARGGYPPRGPRRLNALLILLRLRGLIK